MSPPSKYFVASSDDGGVARFVNGNDEVTMAGINRMHFYRLTGATPEEATDEQVERFFALRSQEDETGERVTEKLVNESATDMVTRELKILNLPQVINPSDPLEEELNQPPLAAPIQEQTSTSLPQRPAARPLDRPAPPPSTSPLGAPPRYQPGGGLPPAPRYQPVAPSGQPDNSQPPPAGKTKSSDVGAPSAAAIGGPQSGYVRADGGVLWIQTPDGNEERVTQYMRTHFLRLIEKDIEQADDADIELWWKSQGSLDAGTTMAEAQSQNMLAEALKAAGKLKLRELELLQQIVDSWLTARRTEGNSSGD